MQTCSKAWTLCSISQVKAPGERHWASKAAWLSRSNLEKHAHKTRTERSLRSYIKIMGKSGGHKRTVPCCSSTACFYCGQASHRKSPLAINTSLSMSSLLDPASPAGQGIVHMANIIPACQSCLCRSKLLICMSFSGARAGTAVNSAILKFFENFGASGSRGCPLLGV